MGDHVAVTLFSIVVLLLFLPACSTLKPSPITVDEKENNCRYLFSDFEQIVSSTERLDSQSAKISGYPYLRINRFLLSYRDELNSDLKYEMWSTQLMALAREAHYYEWRNLPPVKKESLLRKHGVVGSFTERLAECGDYLWGIDHDKARGILPELVDVPEEYRVSWRVLGLYPLTSRIVASQVKKLHRELKKPFLSAVEELPVSGELARYVLADSEDAITAQSVIEILRHSSNNPLNIPLPTQKEQDLLFFRYAPIWEIDQVTDDDRIGQPYWGEERYPGIDLSKPAVYTFVSHTRFEGQVLLQLNYTVWFPARPRTGLFDLYGGRYDGMTWRVTLGHDGQPLMYDTMHNCGCYHQWFPVDGVLLRQAAAEEELEPPLVIDAPKVKPGERMVLRINSLDHYLLNIYPDNNSDHGEKYMMLPYNELRSLTGGERGGRLSLFDEQGIVPGSQRAERWLLWPMGVPSPGAMRQVGHHIIVFAGKRYFDEPYLIERFFRKESISK